MDASCVPHITDGAPTLSTQENYTPAPAGPYDGFYSTKIQLFLAKNLKASVKKWYFSIKNFRNGSNQAKVTLGVENSGV